MKIAINQPNYLPWLPYFHLISSVDKFYFLDNVITANGGSFINRNKLILNNKNYWITVTVKKDHVFSCSIIQLLARYGKKVLEEKSIVYERIY